MNTSAASENIADWSVNWARRLLGTWSTKMENRARPRKKSSRRSRSTPPLGITASYAQTGGVADRLTPSAAHSGAGGGTLAAAVVGPLGVLDRDVLPPRADRHARSVAATTRAVRDAGATLTRRWRISMSATAGSLT